MKNQLEEENNQLQKRLEEMKEDQIQKMKGSEEILNFIKQSNDSQNARYEQKLQ